MEFPCVNIRNQKRNSLISLATTMAFRCPPETPQGNITETTVGTTWQDINSTTPNSGSIGGNVTLFQCNINYQWYSLVEGPLISLLCVVGLVANSLALLVWRSSREHRNHLFFLQVLAITDNFYLLVAFFALPLMKFLPKDSTLFVTLNEITPLMSFLQNTAQSLCILMIVLVTTERYICVCRPLEVHRALTKNGKCWLVGLVYVSSALYNLPYLVSYCMGITGKGLEERGKSGTSGFVRHWHAHASRFLLMFLLPLVALAVMTWRLIRAIRQVRRRQTLVSVCDTDQADLGDHCENKDSDCDRGEPLDEVKPCRDHPNPNISNPRERHEMRCLHPMHHQRVTSSRFKLSLTSRRGSESLTNRQGRKTTTLLVIIVCIFMICQSPEMIYIFSKLLTIDICAWIIFYAIGKISHLLLVVNSSVNFFVYFIFGNQFRESFFRMFRRRR